MIQQDLVALLQSNVSPDSEKTAFCADDHEIAAYVDGSLESHAHQRLERHLAECRVCVGRVGLLTQLIGDWDEAEQASESLLAGARDHVRRRYDLSTPKWVAAAAIALVVIILPNWAPDSGEGPEAGARTTRTVPSAFLAPEILSPATGVSIGPDRLNVSWQAVPESLYYKVRIVSNSGLLISEQRVNGTEWRAPEELNLVSGAEYFVRVDAYFPDARTISSEHVRFTNSGRQ